MHEPLKIYENIYQVGGPEMTDWRDCCVYLIDGGSEMALVDSGVGYSYQLIIDNIRDLGLDVSLLRYVIATHGHIDHSGGLHAFRNNGVKIICHEQDLRAVREGPEELTAAGLYHLKYTPADVDVILKGELQAVTVGAHTLYCLHTPGHTPGCISPYMDIQGVRILFGQDIHGPFNTSWGSDMNQWKVSMEKLIDLKADILCEGHFGIYSPAERVRNYIQYYLNYHC